MAEAPPALLGRALELEILTELANDVVAGKGRVLVVRGPPGVGLSSLLDWLRRRQAPPKTVAARVPVQSQRTAYSAVRELVSSIAPSAPSLPSHRRRVLERILAGRDVEEEPSDVDEVAPAVAELVRSAAAAQPLVIVVDDAHRLDAPSSAVLADVAMQVDGQPVGVVAALHDGERTAFANGHFAGMDVGGLDLEAATALVEGQMSERVIRRVVGATDGNPLAILQACALLSAEQRRGYRPIVGPLPVEPALAAVFEHRLVRLDTAVRRTALVVACEDRLETWVVDAAARALGVDSPSQALRELAAADILRSSHSTVWIGDPLLRSTLYQGASGSERRAAHRALADTLRRRDDLERRAWHLSSVADVSDASDGSDGSGASPVEAVAALVFAAEHAADNGDHLAAAAALERAAELTDDPFAVAIYLAHAARAVTAAGDSPRAAALFDVALTRARDQRARAAVHVARAGLVPIEDGAAQTSDELEHESELVAPDDKKLALLVEAAAAVPALSAGDIRRARECVARARSMDPEMPDDVDAVVSTLEGFVAAFDGTLQARVPLRRVATALLSGPLTTTHSCFLEYVAAGMSWVDDYVFAERLLDRFVEAMRAAAAVGALPLPLAVRSELRWRTGRWNGALSDGDESMRLADAFGNRVLSAYARIAVGRCEASLGDVTSARRRLQEALSIVADGDLGSMRYWGHAALGFTELTGGDATAAVRSLEYAADFAARAEIRSLAAAPWGPDLVEAYVLTGRHAEALELVDRLTGDSGPFPTAWSSAVLGRCRVIVGTQQDVDAAFASAMAAHERVDAPFERARTCLWYAERLRRAHRTNDAVDQFAAAADAFGGLVAPTWLERARAGLAACGRGDLASASPFASLTPRESQVARAIARGDTNREAAAALFLSPRTIESYLASIYRKLGVHSRTQLVQLLVDEL